MQYVRIGHWLAWWPIASPPLEYMQRHMIHKNWTYYNAKIPEAICTSRAKSNWTLFWSTPKNFVNMVQKQRICERKNVFCKIFVHQYRLYRGVYKRVESNRWKQLRSAMQRSSTKSTQRFVDSQMNVFSMTISVYFKAKTLIIIIISLTRVNVWYC